MNRISSVVIALMLTVTTMGTGSLENPEFERINNTPNGFDSHENDTLNRTNTFPFDVLFNDYHEYHEVVSELQMFAAMQLGRRRRDDYTDGTVRIPIESPPQ